ncbi:hypothetical protein VPH35_122478 [Triticum aestivum]
MRSQPRSVPSPAPATPARLLAASSATCELRTALPAPPLVFSELEPPPPPPPLLLVAPSVLDLDLQRTPPPHAFKVSVAPPELLLEGALLPVASPCSVVTTIAVEEEPSLPLALALARPGSQSSKEVLAPDAVVRASRPPLAVSWVSLADEVCSIDNDEELAPLTPLAARCSGGVSDPAAPAVVATAPEASSDLGWVKVGGRCRSASPALALAPRPIPAWLHGRCCRCLARGHRAAVCRDPFRCSRCLENGHRACNCRNPWRPLSSLACPVVPPVSRPGTQQHPPPPSREGQMKSTLPFTALCRGSWASVVSASASPTTPSSMVLQTALADQTGLLQGWQARIESFLERAEAALSRLSLVPGFIC